MRRETEDRDNNYKNNNNKRREMHAKGKCKKQRPLALRNSSRLLHLQDAFYINTRREGAKG